MRVSVKQNPFPANSQNYNRYSYALNNPLVYTDPGGYRYNGGGGGGSYYIDGTQVSSNMFYMWVKRSMKNDPWNDWTIQGFGLIFEDFMIGYLEQQQLNRMEDLKYASYLWEQELKRVGSAPHREHQSFVESSFDKILGGDPPKKNKSTVSTDKPGYNTFGTLINQAKNGTSVSFVEERFIQANFTLGFAGPTFGVSAAKLPNFKTALYYNIGVSVGYDLPNVDIGTNIHWSYNNKTEWSKLLTGKTSLYGGSLSFVGAMLGGNQLSGDFLRVGRNYTTLSIMFNLGFNDFSFGLTKVQTEQKKIDVLSGWLF